MFNDGMESDFFEDLNTLAIVIEVPDSKLGKQIGVWGTTSSENDSRDRQVDRMGRPRSTPWSTAPGRSSGQT